MTVLGLADSRGVQVCLDCADTAAAEGVRQVFEAPTFRVYSGTDLPGVELGGAVENAIVTSDISAFLAGTASNNGWVVKDANESSGAEFVFASRENGTPAKHPQLVVTFTACP
jgi:hypothetical protein